jgi:hypothetical protein
MLRLQRGLPVVYISLADARRGIQDNDWVRVFNKEGETVVKRPRQALSDSSRAAGLPRTANRLLGSGGGRGARGGVPGRVACRLDGPAAVLLRGRRSLR